MLTLPFEFRGDFFAAVEHALCLGLCFGLTPMDRRPMPMKRLLASICLLPLLACIAVSAHAEVRLPKLISDHGVLQRDTPIHVWGWADPGENIHVTFHQQHLATTASDLGKWSVNLSPEKAGGPFDLQVAGTNTLLPDSQTWNYRCWAFRVPRC
jgi:hypothetical protein